MKYLFYLSIVGLVLGCAKDTSHEVSTIVQEQGVSVESIVMAENLYRSLLGQTKLTKGLVCTLYTVPSGSSGIMGAAPLTKVTSYSYLGEFYQPDSSVDTGLSILPDNLRSLYRSWFMVRCSGKLVVVNSDYYKLTLSSDDGSLLYLDGKLLIDNDGNHAVTSKSATKLLKSGVHDFRVDYMQGPAGNQALVLLMNDYVLSSETFYR